MGNRVVHVVAAASICAALVLGGTACSGEDDEPKETKATTTTAVVVTSAELDLTTILGADAQFSTFLELAKVADIESTLADGSEYTILAPNTEAFAALGEERLAELRSGPSEELTALISRHIVEGSLTRADLVDAADGGLTTIDGQELTVTLTAEDAGQAISIGNAKVIKTDIAAKAGMIHVLDAVITG